MKIKYIVCSFALLLALSSCEKKQEKYEQRDVKIDTVFDNSNSNVGIIDQNNNSEVNSNEDNVDLNNNQDGETYRVTTSVNLRQTPTVDEDNYIDAIPANTEVTFIEEIENNYGETWSKITYKGKTGFVASNFLEEIVENSLRKAGLWEEVKDRLSQPGTGLSGGQQQRLCIARTIAVSPEVILMDEPCSALDPIATAKIEELISELSEQYTIAIVTHSMQQAARVSDRTAYFHLGDLIEVNATEKVFTQPDHQLTEAYITGRFG